jgi:hypothetical protein
LPVYERFLSTDLRRTGVEPAPAPTSVDRWVSERIERAIDAPDDAGERYRTVLAGGAAD